MNKVTNGKGRLGNRRETVGICCLFGVKAMRRFMLILDEYMMKTHFPRHLIKLKEETN